MAPRMDVSFDLVVATLGREAELHHLLASLEEQAYDRLRVLLVDQNGDDRLQRVVAAHAALDVVTIESRRGLSRARNSALPHLRADVVGFPDDDCSYPPGLLERLAGRFAADGELGGLTGRTVDPDGSASARWPVDGGEIRRESLWHRCNSASTFLRRAVLETTGPFDETLGLGAGSGRESGEEIDLVARALAAGTRIEYDPSFVVLHPARRLSPGQLRAVGRRDGGSVGYVLAKNRFPAGVVARMLLRPCGGIALGLLRFDLDSARFHAAALRGRVTGYTAGRRAARRSAKSSA